MHAYFKHYIVHGRLFHMHSNKLSQAQDSEFGKTQTFFIIKFLFILNYKVYKKFIILRTLKTLDELIKEV